MKKLKTILLVEDDDTVNFYNEFLLKQLEVTDKIIIRENGEEALNYLETCNRGENQFPDLIFLDINMPVMNGFEFLEAYEKRSFSDQAGALIVMLTTSLHPNDIKRADGFESISEYVYKPLNPEKVTNIIGKHFQTAS